MSSFSNSNSSNHLQLSQTLQLLYELTQVITQPLLYHFSVLITEPSNSFIKYQTAISSTIPLSTVSNLAYIFSSAPISEPNKPLVGLEYRYATEEYIQHIETHYNTIKHIEACSH